MASSFTRQQLEEWLKTITVKGCVLDVGGSQNPVIKRLDKTKIFIDEYKILDLEQPHEYKQKPDIVGDLNDYYEGDFICPWSDYVDYFDVAFCLEVSEYWYNPFQALKNIAYLTKPNGVLYSSYHFIYPVHNPPQYDYLRYTPAGVEKLLQKTGFRIEEMKPRLVMNIGNLYGWWSREGMRPTKDNYRKHDWAGVLVKATKL